MSGGWLTLALAWFAGVLILRLVCMRSVKRSAGRRQERRRPEDDPRPAPVPAPAVAPDDDVEFLRQLCRRLDRGDLN